jgi:hypothetical protein
MKFVTLRNNRPACIKPQDEKHFGELHYKKHPSEERWTVPLSYYDDWRNWFGQTHCDVPYFIEGQLLIYGPPRSGAPNRDWLTGKPVLFDAPCEGGESVHWGAYSWIMSPLGRIMKVRTHRLVPIELCEPATLETWVEMQLGMVMK